LFSIITIVAILFVVFADIFAVAIMGIVSVTNSRYNAENFVMNRNNGDYEFLTAV